MSNDIDFKNLWQARRSESPDIRELMTRLKKMRRSAQLKMYFTSLAMAATSAFIIWIWVSWQPQMVTTKMGIVLVILAMGIYSLMNYRQRPILNELGNSNADFVGRLIELKEKQKFLDTTMLGIYFIMLSAGLCLYMIEPVSYMTLQSGVITFAVTAAWILFNWFYLRPHIVRKRRAKIDDLIEKFTVLKDQFGENK